MRREFAINLAILLAINALVKPLYLFGVDLGVQNAVGTEEYGRYATWFSFAFLFGVVYDLGLLNYNSVTLSKQPGLLRERLPVMLSLKLVLSLVYAGLVLGSAYVYGATGRELWLVALAVAYHASLSLLQLMRTNLGAQGKYRFNSFVSVIDRALLIVVVGGILLFPAALGLSISIEGFFLAQIVAILIATGVAIGGTQLAPGQRWLSWKPQEAIRLARSAAPYALVLLLTTAFTRIDVVMIEALAPDGTYQAGQYAGAYRLLDGINMVGFMFASLLVPMLSKHVADGLPVGALLRQAATYLIAISVGLAAWTSFNGASVMEALYTEATPAWGQTLQVLMWAATGVGFTYVYGSYLLTRERFRLLNSAFGLALLGNVVLNAVLVPTYGATGAASATLLTQGGIALFEYFATLRAESVLHQRPFRRVFAQSLPFLPLLGFLLACLAGGYVLRPSSLGGVLPGVLAQAVWCLVAGLATGVLGKPSELLALVRGGREIK